MKWRSLSYVLLVLSIFSWSCAPKDFPMTQEFKDNNHSSKFDYPGLRLNLIRFLDYSVFKYDKNEYTQTESTIRAGIILSGRSLRSDITEVKVLFGKIADTCSIDCLRTIQYDHYGRSATMSVINLFSKNSNKMPQETSDKVLNDGVRGTIEYAATSTAFAFENLRPGKRLAGWLIINADSFLLKPVVVGNSFLGMQLLKGDMMYAAIARPFNEGDRMYMYSKTSATEQMLIAAYFAIIKRNW